MEYILHNMVWHKSQTVKCSVVYKLIQCCGHTVRFGDIHVIYASDVSIFLHSVIPAVKCLKALCSFTSDKHCTLICCIWFGVWTIDICRYSKAPNDTMVMAICALNMYWTFALTIFQIRPSDDFDAETRASQLREAMEGIGKWVY